jgi:hypothetical protein
VVFQNVIDSRAGTVGAYFKADEDAVLIREANVGIDGLLERFWV